MGNEHEGERTGLGIHLTDGQRGAVYADKPFGDDVFDGCGGHLNLGQGRKTDKIKRKKRNGQTGSGTRS